MSGRMSWVLQNNVNMLNAPENCFFSSKQKMESQHAHVLLNFKKADNYNESVNTVNKSLMQIHLVFRLCPPIYFQSNIISNLPHFSLPTWLET